MRGGKRRAELKAKAKRNSLLQKIAAARNPFSKHLLALWNDDALLTRFARLYTLTLSQALQPEARIDTGEVKTVRAFVAGLDLAFHDELVRAIMSRKGTMFRRLAYLTEH